MKYSLNELEVFNIAVNTETSAELVMMSAWLRSQGKQSDLIPEDWDVSEENTCIILTQNPKTPLIVTDKGRCERVGFDIITADDQFDIKYKRPKCNIMEEGLLPAHTIA